ncbi:MAG: PKD domain-containing protein [Vicinamibacterales bacterium]
MSARAHRFVLVLVAALLTAACTIKNQEAPPLTGPSEFGTSISIAVSPDVLQTDGGSQSLVTITARDANGQPLRNVSLRTEIQVDGITADFGTLSARNVVTDAQGRATVVYTAPSITGGVDTGLRVDISATPIGSNYGDSVARTATIRLVPTGVVVPADGLQPNFTFSPSNPTQAQSVLFESTSTAPALNPIASYRWDFGDGATATGRTAQHAYSSPAIYFARLTITDALGRSAFTTKSVTVGASTVPTASFTLSPTDPSVGNIVNFNAQASTAATGRRIASYTWDFGDGASGTGVQSQHAYAFARTYTVTLTVTDDVGRTNTTSRTLTVK